MTLTDDLYAMEFVRARDFHKYNRTLETQTPIDEEGKPIPWLTYPAIQYLKQLSFREKTIFEYGCGNSTLYWGKRAKSVTSVEDNSRWFDEIQANAPANCRVLHLSGDAYVAAIASVPAPDVVVVDGRWRFDCMISAIRHVADDGMIILDNSERYPEITTLGRKAGYIQIDMIGPTPGNWYTSATSLFLSRSFMFDPETRVQPCYTAGNIDSIEIFPDKFAEVNQPGSY